MGTVTHLLDSLCPQISFGRLDPALASSRAGLEPGLVLLKGLQTPAGKDSKEKGCLGWESRGEFNFT